MIPNNLAKHVFTANIMHYLFQGPVTTAIHRNKGDLPLPSLPPPHFFLTAKHVLQQRHSEYGLLRGLPALPPAAFSPGSWSPVEILLVAKAPVVTPGSALSLLRGLLCLSWPAEARLPEVWSLFYNLHTLPQTLSQGKNTFR